MRKRITILAVALVLSSGVYAQKNELKTLKKIYSKEKPSEKDVAEYKTAVAQAETYLATASEADKAEINYYKAEIPFMDLEILMQKPENQNNPMVLARLFTPQNLDAIAKAYAEMRSYEQKAGKSVFTKEIDQTVASYGPMILDAAIALGKQQKFNEASKLLYNLYLMDKKNPDNLFYAASYAVNGEDFDNALKYYEELKAINYTGVSTAYYASEITTGKEQPFGSKAERDKAVSLKLYDKPREEKLPSRKSEIYKNIALILVQKGKVEEAKTAYADAIRENPTDTSLQIGEANLHLQLKDNEGYKNKVAAILAKDPNNAELVYNIGVLAMEAKQDAEAEKNFRRALEIDPKYVNAYMNLSVMLLKDDDKLVKEMNALGTSDKDNKRYEVLKKQRTQTFNAVMPLLETAYDLAPDNEAVANNLLSVYNFLELTSKPKYQELKAKKKASQGN